MLISLNLWRRGGKEKIGVNFHTSHIELSIAIIRFAQCKGYLISNYIYWEEIWQVNSQNYFMELVTW